MLVSIKSTSLKEVITYQDHSVTFDVVEGYFSPEDGRQQIVGALEILGDTTQRLEVLEKWASAEGYTLMPVVKPKAVYVPSTAL